MNNAKFRLGIHLLAQVMAQSAVATLVPTGAEKYWAAAVAIVGVLVAFFDTTATQKDDSGN